VKFAETPLPGAYLINSEMIQDERGFFARTYCDGEFAEAGLSTEWPQENLSYNSARHTLRGMHFNRGKYAEEKTVQVTAGAIYDVIVDLREGSKTRFDWYGVELTASNRRMLFVPKGFAHGFLTLARNTDVRYRMSRRYEPMAAEGLRWDDPHLGIDWPARPRVINSRDATYRYISDRPEELT
jgi:dTDP-4-dehydrorhamnose 3,5-epimerase